ncbi:hypothetical protein MHM98_09760 [Psychrobium sp. MM17-31]|uniref:hypothetical protein n=1 Tax=Psychrobium sp. MM17-31 TaxID=2917758 RepID=UPI001EF5B263|nr:hypothetical protein [Psychrobium sp. MM17-31]MCG7531625.1 hypothetical protein [Psychrobium sp. MM17-31]
MTDYQLLKTKISAILVPLNYVEVTIDTERDLDGSVDCIYALGASRFMVSWDGEEDCGMLEKWTNNTWIMVGNIVHGSSKTELVRSVDELCRSLKITIQEKNGR